MSSRQRTRKGLSPLAGLGVLILVLALAAGGWLVWLLWGTSALAERAAEEQVSQLRSRWESASSPSAVRPSNAAPSPSAAPSPTIRLRPATDLAQGRSEWVLRLPKFGDDHAWPVAVGVDAPTLDGALGWYPGTAQPGQVGNFAVAGYKVTAGAPFSRLTELAVGDEVVVESADAVFTYRIIHPASQLTVQSGDAWVLDPVPGQPDAVATQAFITLTTSEDLVPTTDRSVAFGVLETTELK